MPLIDLQTNLRDLKFGRDRVDGDSSNQPFIQTKLPGINESLQTKVSLSVEGVGDIVAAAIRTGITGVSPIGSSGINIDLQLPVAGTGGTDFILRGGTLLSNKIEKDVKRLSKFFTSPNGTQFILKQNLLSRLSVKTQSSGLIFNDGIYTPFNTLAQAGGVAFGLSIPKQLPGLNNISDIFSDKGKYEREVYERNNNDWEKNSRLFQLQNSIVTEEPYFLGGIGIGDSKIGGIKLNPDPSILLSYGGGPTSPYGIGRTNIRFASERAFNAPPTSPSNTTSATHIVTASDINTNTVKQTSNPTILDFRKIRKGLTQQLDITYTSNIEDNFNLGSPGNGNKTDFRHDKINALPIYKSEKVKSNNSSFPTKDIIPFRIGVIDNNTPSKKTYIHFRAFLDNISDSFTSEWKSQKYIGRGEDFYTYGGFDRKVSLSWTVAAQSKAELIPMYKKLNYLASVAMPDYSPSGYMRGNMVTLTVGGYFHEQPGIITGFSYDMNDDSATWEIGIDEDGKEDTTTSQLPHLIKVKGFNFIPIHTFVPRLQQNTFGTAILNDNGNLSLNENNDDDVEYGKEHFIALTKEYGSDNNLYTIDDLGDIAKLLSK